MGRDLIVKANTLYEQTLDWLRDKEKIMLDQKREAKEATESLRVQIINHISGKMQKSSSDLEKRVANMQKKELK